MFYYFFRFKGRLNKGRSLCSILQKTINNDLYFYTCSDCIKAMVNKIIFFFKRKKTF